MFSQIYGGAWDGDENGVSVRFFKSSCQQDNPIHRDLIKIPDNEIKAIRREAEIIATGD
jgi:hypothetical protein